MPRVCTVCAHAERDAIESALVAGTASYRHIAAQYGLAWASVKRHEDSHLPAALAHAEAACETTHANDLLREVRALHAAALRQLAAGEQAGDWRQALAAIREARGTLELLAKLLGELDERPQLNVLLAPEWIAVRAALMGALAPYSDARAAAASALLKLST